MSQSGVHRRLAAILAADVVGYSRLMGEHETATLAALKAHREELIQPAIAEYHGRVVKLMGDGLLAEFGSVVDAVECAIAIQRQMGKRNVKIERSRRIDFRIGVNMGDVIVDGDDLYGDGVNVAARLEQLAQPGKVCVAGVVRDQVFEKVAFTFDDLGEVEVKNIARPIRIYRVAEKSAPASASEIPLPLRNKPSIAVLPFLNMSGDPDQEYFSDGVTEDIITALSRLRWFFVIARNSSFVYKGRSVDVKEIGYELGVRYVLEGSVRKAGNRIRVSAQLVDTMTGAHHWAQTYDRDITDIFELQDDITQSVAAAIEPKLVAAEAMRSESRSPADLDAWDLVMRALTHYWRMTTAESDTAIELLREAVQRHPEYGPAHSMLAFALLFSGHVGWTPESEDYEYATKLAHRAAELDDDDPWAHIALGYLAFTERQTGEAVREYHRALELNPNFGTAYALLGWALAFDAQSEEAIQNFERAIRMSPHDPLKAFFYSGTGVAHYLAKRYEEAVEWGMKAIHQRPGFTAAYRILCASLAQASMTEETREMTARLREMQPNISISWCEKHVPYTPRAMPHFLEGMRMAGIE
jgi:TolB-like protein/Flp pilus assembly protein TadD